MLAQLQRLDHLELETEADEIAGDPVEVVVSELELGVLTLFVEHARVRRDEARHVLGRGL